MKQEDSDKNLLCFHSHTELGPFGWSIILSDISFQMISKTKNLIIWQWYLHKVDFQEPEFQNKKKQQLLTAAFP